LLSLPCVASEHLWSFTQELRTSIVTFQLSYQFVEVLGLKSDASEKDIKQAYFKYAKKYHPDLNPNGDTRDKFDKI